MTPFVDLGGHPLKTSEDRYADGRKCTMAEHTDLPGCVVYADSLPAALAALKEARDAYLASVRRHAGTQTPIGVSTISPMTTASSGAGMEMQPA